MWSNETVIAFRFRFQGSPREKHIRTVRFIESTRGTVQTSAFLGFVLLENEVSLVGVSLRS